MLESAEERRADLAAEIARGRVQRTRRRTARAAAALAAAVVLGALTVVFDWGWVAWSSVLAIAALALVVTSLRFGTAVRIVAVLAAAALVAVGVVAVRIPPILPPGWTVDEDEHIIAAEGDVVVVLDSDDNTMRGLASADGDELWAADPQLVGTPGSQSLGDVVLVYSDNPSGSAVAAVVSVVDGKIHWRRDIGELDPLSANDDVVVFTSDAETTGLDVGTGRTVWTHPGVATTGSGGNRDSPRRWAPREQWAAVKSGPDSRYPAMTVINARTGKTAATVHPTSNDFVIAGDTFIEFGYAQQRRVIKGTALAGGRSWVKEYNYDGNNRLFDVVDGKARVLRTDKAAFIDSVTGDVQETAIEEGWSVDWYSGTVGGRYTLVEQRDRDHRVTARAVADTVKGGLLAPKGPGTVTDARIAKISGESMVLHEDVVDAVGAESERYTFVDNGAFRGQAALPEVVEGFSSVSNVVQVDGHVVVLDKS